MNLNSVLILVSDLCFLPHSYSRKVKPTSAALAAHVTATEQRAWTRSAQVKVILCTIINRGHAEATDASSSLDHFSLFHQDTHTQKKTDALIIDVKGVSHAGGQTDRKMQCDVNAATVLPTAANIYSEQMK